MDFLKKASYYLSNNQNLRRGIFISVAIIFLLVVVLFNSDIQNLLKRPGVGKAAGPIESDNNWSDLDNIDTARSNAKMIDVVQQNGERWLYLIGGTEKIYDSEYYDPFDWQQNDAKIGERLALVSEVERMQINDDGSPIVGGLWEPVLNMTFGHAEFGLLEHNGYIYVISGDMHMPIVDDPDNEFPMLYSTIERLSINNPSAGWEVVALVTGVNFYPEVKIHNNQLHIVGGVYGNPFVSSTYNLYNGYGARDPMVLEDDAAAWDGIKNKPKIGDLPFWIGDGGLGQNIITDNGGIDPGPGIGPIDMGSVVIMGVTDNSPDLNSQVVIQQNDGDPIRNILPGMPPWYPGQSDFGNYNLLFSQLLLAGEFYTTVSEHYVVDLDNGNYTWSAGELDSDYISTQPLIEDEWVYKKVIKIFHLRLVLTYSIYNSGYVYPTIRPAPQGRYGHKLAVHNGDLLTIGGASWSNPWTFGLPQPDGSLWSTSFLFWVTDDDIHPFTATNMWAPTDDLYTLYGYDYRYVGNITYKWSGNYWEGTNTDMASFQVGTELSNNYAFFNGNFKRGKAFFGLSELNLLNNENIFVVSGGLENTPFPPGGDLNSFYREFDQGWSKFGIPIDITSTVHKLELIDNGWQEINLEDQSTAPNSYGLISIGLDNYRSISINGQTEFHVVTDDQFTNIHVPDYTLNSTNDTSMFDNVAWVKMPSSPPGAVSTLDNLAYPAIHDVRTTVNGKTTIYVYRAGGSDSETNAWKLPNPVITSQYMGPFTYGVSGVPNPYTSEFSIDPPVVLADGMHYAKASGILRDYNGVPVADKQVALSIDNDQSWPPIYEDGTGKVLPVPDNLKVRAQDVPDNTVTVNAGYVLFDDGNGGFKKVEMGAISSAPFEQSTIIGQHRIDLLVLDENGLLQIVKGVEASVINPSPNIPPAPNNTIALASVYIKDDVPVEILDSDIGDVRDSSLKFGAGNSPSELSGWSQKFIETDASGAFQFRLFSTVAIQHNVWLHINISPIPNASSFIKVGPWDVEFTLDGAVSSRASSLVANPNQVVADGIEKSTVTITLLDHNGMPATNYWVDTFSSRNEFTTNGYITAFADGGSGKVVVTSTNHELPEGSVITISNTTNYNNIYTISNVNINTFEIDAIWVSNDATGIWTVDLVDNISLAPGYTNPVPDVNGQVRFLVNSNISGLSMMFGKYSISQEGLSSDYKQISDVDTIEFGGYISGLVPDSGKQGQALEYIVATGAKTNWDVPAVGATTTTEVEFISPAEISFQETGSGIMIDDLRIIADGDDSAELKVIAPEYPNADLELTIIAGSGNFFGIVPVSLDGFGEAHFVYNSGTIVGIVKIKARINNLIENEIWFIEDDPVANNYELEITVENPHLGNTVNSTTVRSAIWFYAGGSKYIVDDINQNNQFDFSSDDNGSLIPSSPLNNPTGVAQTTYTKDTEDGRARIFVEVDFRPHPLDDPIHLMASQLIVKKSTGSIDGIIPDSLTILSAEKIDMGGETVSGDHVHISETARVGLWTVSVYTPDVASNPFGISVDEVVQYPFRVLPATGPVDGFGPMLVSVKPWYGVFGETEKVVDIIGINTNFSNNVSKSVVAFTPTDVSQPANSVTVTKTTVFSSTHVQVEIDIFSITESKGWYNVSVTTDTEVAIKPGNEDFLVTGDSNYALYLYSNVDEIPRDGQSQANITARVVFIDPTDGSITPREDIPITFNHSDAGPVKPPILDPLNTNTNNEGFAYSLYTTDAGDVNELIDITATAEVVTITGEPTFISNKINILKVVYPYSGFILSANPDSLPLYGSPTFSNLTAEGLPAGSNIPVWFDQVMGKGYVVPLKTTTSTGTANTRYYSADEGERIPETVEIEAFAIVPGIGIVKSNSALIQIGEYDADYQLSLIAVPNQVQAGGLLVSNITAALSFLGQPSSNWPLNFELVQEQAGDYLTETSVWTDYPTGLAKTEFVPGYIAGAIMVRARPMGLNIVKEVIVTKVADQNPDEYLTTISAVPRYVPTSNGSDFSVVTVTVRNADFSPLENVVVQLTTDRLNDTIRLDNGNLGSIANTNENGQAMFRISSTDSITNNGLSTINAIVSTFSVSTTIVFEDPALLTSRFLDVRVPFQARDYDNLTWIFVSEEVPSGDPLVFANEVYTKIARPDDRLTVLKNIKMYFHLDETYNLWAKGRNHLSRVQQFFPGDKTGEGETIEIDMTKIVNNKEYGLFIADLKPDLRDSDGNGNMVPSPFHDNAINSFDFGLMINNFYKNHYTANVNWPIDEVVNSFDTLYVFMNYGAGEEGGPPPYD